MARTRKRRHLYSPAKLLDTSRTPFCRQQPSNTPTTRFWLPIFPMRLKWSTTLSNTNGCTITLFTTTFSDGILQFAPMVRFGSKMDATLSMNWWLNAMHKMQFKNFFFVISFFYWFDLIASWTSSEKRISIFIVVGVWVCENDRTQFEEILFRRHRRHPFNIARSMICTKATRECVQWFNAFNWL